MKGKKVFYIALFFALIFMLFRCEGRDSREYLEERVGIPISRVYPTKNLEDLFLEFPNGFTIYQSYRLEGKFIDIELDGVEKGKPIEGTIKQIDIKSGAEEKKIAVTYDKGKYSYDNEEEARKLWSLEKFLFQELTLNKEVLSKFKLKDTYYNGNNGSFEIDYVVKNEQINEFLGLEKKQQVTLGLHGSNSNKRYYYSLTVEIDKKLDFIERIEE
ncbi:hypothetical protein NQ540_08280 [Granulicatella adiacens ATCC 49175]|uniref:Lipoprotein n=1 Tax=Granulicatella adiacens ATCC 49175 TaxID=638301 RepID=C8NI90_9LACT|nr:hypothetical protein [Granulicatella adiacens]EEW36646.1 hypothetical protein HMPREF0444_1635 [Granulicatella adiacens ATCC 49175]UAK93121.1 hypothetical protein K8O88_06305 [Granulicatella adiacens]UWP37888.1 hypothetical protein NQ540_08280 [Granulicatella adiacens ATCC 49175]